MLADALARTNIRKTLSAYVLVCRRLLSGSLVGIFCGTLAAIWFSPVLAAHFADGDAFYAHASVIPQYEHVGIAQAFAAIVHNYDRVQGGWYPLGAVPLAAWLIDSHFGVARDLQYLLIVATFVLFAVVAQRLTNSKSAAVIAVCCCIASWQFRMPHDPVIGTSLVTPWAALLTLAGVAAWLRYLERNSARDIIAACILIASAMFCGPVSWAVCVCFALIALALRRPGSAWLAAAAIIASTVLLAMGGLPTPLKHGGAYALNVLNQVFAALPGSYRAAGHLPLGHVPSLYHNGYRYNDDRFINIPSPSRWAWIGVLMAAAGTYAAVSRLAQNREINDGISALAAGGILWVAPALLLGPHAVWPDGLPWGQSFDGVLFEYFGVGLCGAGLIQLFARRLAIVPVMACVAALFVFAACYGNVRADGASLAKSARADLARGAVERAGNAGFFDNFEDGTTFAVSPELVPANAEAPEAQTVRYLLYHYGMKRFDIVSVTSLERKRMTNVWILQAPLKAALSVTAKRVARWDGGPRTDRAFGYTVFSYVADLAGVRRRGVNTTATPLSDGFLIYAGRLCGPVPPQEAFAEARPRLVYGHGFFESGPVGYQKPPQATDALGDVSTDPNMYKKMFMARSGELRIYETACPRGFINLKAVAVSMAPSMLTIKEPDSTVEHIRVDSVGAHFWLRYDMRKQRSPLLVRFVTTAPEAPQFDPIIFHYERDVPRRIRIVFEPEGLWEDSANANHR